MFAVIYKFRVFPEKEVDFKSSWEAMTHEFRDRHGGLGSCLHKADDGLFYAYARWPSRELWKAKKEIFNVEAMDKMRNSVAESYPSIPLEVEKDLLKL